MLPLSPGDVLVPIDAKSAVFLREAPRQEGETEFLEFAQAVQESILTEAGYSVIIGIGAKAKDLSALHAGFLQASRAISIGRIFCENQTVFDYASMLLPRFLSELSPDIAERYHHLLFNPSTSRLFNEEMLRTIEVFFQEYDPACNARLGSSTRNVSNSYDGLPYVRLLSCALRAAKVGVIKGILLHQGEANRTDPLWCMKVKHVYDDLLHDLGLQARDVPLLAGQVVGEEQHGKSAIANNNVNALPKTIPTAHVISSVGCEADPDDTHHFSAEGYRTFGRRYADVMLDLMGVEH